MQGLLAASLLELLDKQPIQKISAREIAANCGLSTRTFYNYYRDKNELVSQIYCDMSESAWYTNGKLNTLEEYLSAWIYHAHTDYLNFFINTFAYRGQNNLRETIHKKGVADLIRLIQANGHWDAVTQDAERSLSVYMYGLIGYFEETVLTSPQNADLKIWSEHQAQECLPKSIYDALIG